MNLNQKKILLTVLIVLLAVAVGAAVFLNKRGEETPSKPTVPCETAPTEDAAALNTEPGTEPGETAAPTETVPPTEPTETVPAETEPAEQRYTLTFAGDCTLGSIASNWNNGNHFVQTIGENYDYPFDNVRSIFENDDFTIINLEGPLTDTASGAASKRFSFRGPTAYTQIMSGSSVEAVTLANNHSEDYGKTGYDSTTKALTEAGIAYVEKNKTTLYTTESGLTIGLYAGSFDISAANVKKGITQLRNDGAEIVICAFHWGKEGEYRPTADQQKLAKAAIDAGADIVYGHHPHVLQKIETYKKGYIFYSLGNFSFGGAALPGDYDTALLQVDVLRDENGKAYLGELTIIPCSISSVSGRNNFQPTPLQAGSVYDRVLSKLDGSFNGPNLNVDYSKLDPKPEETTPPATDAPSGGDSGDSGGATPTTPPSGGDSGGGDSGGSSSGDSGSSGGGDSGSGSSGDGGSSGGGDSGGGSGGEAPAPSPDPAPAPDSGSEG